MNRLLVALSIILLFSFKASSQISPADKIALEIPENATYSTRAITSYVKSRFASDSERVRAIFVWVANNINYDVEKVRTKNLRERTTVDDVLMTRKAVCQGYAELFVELCKESNINAVMVPGYTKSPDGTISDLPHAWVAAEINKKWFLFDPTWAAGTVENFQFARRFSNRYYKRLPEEMISDHMPFDPMYQFINYPVMYDEFKVGNITINTSRPFFSYVDTIKQFNSLDTLNQCISAARRINRNGERNQIINEMLEVLNKNQQFGLSRAGFEGAVAQFNKGIEVYNRYINYKNYSFGSIKNQREIQQMIDTVLLNIKTAYSLLENVVPGNDDHRQNLADFNSVLLKFYRKVDEESIFLKSYLSGRK